MFQTTVKLYFFNELIDHFLLLYLCFRYFFQGVQAWRWLMLSQKHLSKFTLSQWSHYPKISKKGILKFWIRSNKRQGWFLSFVWATLLCVWLACPTIFMAILTKEGFCSVGKGLVVVKWGVSWGRKIIQFGGEECWCFWLINFAFFGF